jgi:N-methylhydantoinase B
MSIIDRINLGIFWDRLIAITDETLNTLVRTSFSANVRESYDLSCTLFDGNARLIAQGSYSVPSFTGTAPETIRAMLERFPSETLQPGDVIATNDPWIGTGHLYDINVMRPIFRDGRIIAYSMSITHLPDIGGLGFSATARLIYEEGLRIPICKLVEAGTPNALLLDIVKSNVRVPDQTLGDLHANIACNEVSARLLMEFMDEYQLSSLDDVADQIIESSELALRKAIEAIPDGSYHHAIQIEGESEPLTLSITLDVCGNHIHGDFAGSSPEVNMGINVPLSYAKAFVAYTVKCLFAPNLPNNLGNVRPITVSAPENCILNAKHPFPTGGRHIIGHFVSPLVMGALAQIVPNAVQADSGMLSLVNIQGRGSKGRGISSIYFSSGGFGALDGIDGANTVPSPSNMTGTSIEVWEELTGMTILSKSLRPDSGGNGRNRGGLGQIIIFRNDSGTELTISCLAGRTEFPALGYAGGQAGALRTYLINGEEVHPKGRYQLAVGDVLTILEPGGGGFGPPSERSSAAIELDLKLGFITPEGARRVYGLCVADPVLAKKVVPA